MNPPSNLCKNLYGLRKEITPQTSFAEIQQKIGNLISPLLREDPFETVEELSLKILKLLQKINLEDKTSEDFQSSSFKVILYNILRDDIDDDHCKDETVFGFPWRISDCPMINKERKIITDDVGKECGRDFSRSVIDCITCMQFVKEIFINSLDTPKKLVPVFFEVFETKISLQGPK